MTEEVVALPLSDLIHTKFMLGPKKIKSWNFKDKVSGKQNTGSQVWSHVYYDQENTPLMFSIDEVKSYSGMQTGKDLKSGFMSVSLQKELSDQIRAKVDTPLFNLAFLHRKTHWGAKGAKVTDPMEMRISYYGVVSDGKEKSPGSEDHYDDSLTANIAMKRTKQQPVVNLDLCSVEDAEGNAFSINALEGKVLKEVVIHVEKIVFALDKIRVHCNYRLIVVDEKAAPKVTTRRRLTQKAEPTADASVAAVGSTPAPVVPEHAPAPAPIAAPVDVAKSAKSATKA